MTSISLRIWGKSFSSLEVSRKLKLEPWIVRAPDRREIPKGSLEDIAGYWSYNFNFDPLLNLEKAICEALKILEDRKEVFSELNQNDLEAEFFIGCEFAKSYGFIIPWDILRKISQLRINLSLDLYIAATDSERRAS